MDPAGRAVHPPGCDTRTRIPEPSRRRRRVGRILGTPPDADQGDSVVTARVASVVARAATSMAPLWRDQGKREEARELLAPVFASLLDQLGGFGIHICAEMSVAGQKRPK